MRAWVSEEKKLKFQFLMSNQQVTHFYDKNVSLVGLTSKLVGFVVDIKVSVG